MNKLNLVSLFQIKQSLLTCKEITLMQIKNIKRNTKKIELGFIPIELNHNLILILFLCINTI